MLGGNQPLEAAVQLYPEAIFMPPVCSEAVTVPLLPSLVHPPRMSLTQAGSPLGAWVSATGSPPGPAWLCLPHSLGRSTAHQPVPDSSPGQKVPLLLNSVSQGFLLKILAPHPGANIEQAVTHTTTVTHQPQQAIGKELFTKCSLPARHHTPHKRVHRDNSSSP